MAPLPILAHNVFGQGIGRWMIASEDYSCADQHIGGLRRGKMNGISGDHGIEHSRWNMERVVTLTRARCSLTSEVTRRDVRSDDADRPLPGTRSSRLQREAVCGEVAGNPCRARD